MGLRAHAGPPLAYEENRHRSSSHEGSGSPTLVEGGTPTKVTPAGFTVMLEAPLNDGA